MANETRAMKIQDRIEWVRRELAAYDHSLLLLEGFAKGGLNLKGREYRQAVKNYRQTPADKARLPFTLANIHQQRALRLKELEVLLEYVA